MRLRASRVGVQRGGRTILHDINLDIGPGEFVALIGPNGAGKSTLLSVLVGDTVPDAGRVQLGDDAVAQMPTIALAQQRAVLEQQPGVGFGFTVAEVVVMGRSPWRHTEHTHDDQRIIAESMRTAEVHQFADRNAMWLSGGEVSRTGFARVLAQQTPWWFLDEPTAALDIRHQEQALRTVRAMTDAGGSAVVVLHDLDAAACWATRLVLLHRGSVLADGPPESVLDPELLSDVYATPVEVFPHPANGNLVVRPQR